MAHRPYRRWGRIFGLSVALSLLAAAPGHSFTTSLPGPFTEDYGALHGVYPDDPERTLLASSDDGDWWHAVTAIEAATPPADCDPLSDPEPGRQGRVPLADYDSGRALDPYTCNAEAVSHYGFTGGFQVHRYVDGDGRECAYYDSTLIAGKDIPKGAEPGVYAIDMSDSAKPVRTAVLNTPGMLSPHESLRLNQGRGLLVGNMGSPQAYTGSVDVYDVTEDCRTPQLRSTLPLPLVGHEGGFSPDGRTYWVTSTAAPGITAIDLTDPSQPNVLWRVPDYAVHGLNVSADGNRLYLAEVADYVTTTAQGAGGLTILDVSEIQSRMPLPEVREVGRLTWPEVTIPQNNVPVTIDGHPYIIHFDEYDSNVWSHDPDNVVGGVRIIDIRDETEPRTISRIRLEVHQREARLSEGQRDDPGAQTVGQGYAAHYCSVPREVDPQIVACSMIMSGLRVFDVRDPHNPRELAYFNQPLVSGLNPSERGAYAMSAPAFAPERGEIWYSDANTGFFNVRLRGEAYDLLTGAS